MNVRLFAIRIIHYYTCANASETNQTYVDWSMYSNYRKDNFSFDSKC